MSLLKAEMSDLTNHHVEVLGSRQDSLNAMSVALSSVQGSLMNCWSNVLVNTRMIK